MDSSSLGFSNLINISPLSVLICRSWKDLTPPVQDMFWWPFVMTFSNNRLTVSYRSRYNTLTFTIPLHRSVHNRSSEWSVDNSSLGQQNVSWNVDHIQWESKMHERANLIHYHKHSSMQHKNYREYEHVQSFFFNKKSLFPSSYRNSHIILLWDEEMPRF